MTDINIFCTTNVLARIESVLTVYGSPSPPRNRHRANEGDFDLCLEITEKAERESEREGTARESPWYSARR